MCRRVLRTHSRRRDRRRRILINLSQGDTRNILNISYHTLRNRMPIPTTLRTMRLIGRPHSRRLRLRGPLLP